MNKRYCEFCEENMEVKRTIENTEVNIEGVKIKFDKIINRCVDCEKEVDVQEDTEQNVKIAHEIYLKAKNK